LPKEFHSIARDIEELLGASNLTLIKKAAVCSEGFTYKMHI
jgi:hypothetical protein